MRRICYLAEMLLESQDGLYSVEKVSKQFVCVMLDLHETSNSVTSLNCHAPVLLITLINSTK